MTFQANNEAQECTCEHCGGKFVKRHNTRGRFCSRTCSQAAIKVKKVSVPCVVCSAKTEIYPNRIRENNCCSARCQARFAGMRSWRRRKRKKALPVLYINCRSVDRYIKPCPSLAVIRSQIGRIKHKRASYIKLQEHEARWRHCIQYRLNSGKGRKSIARKGVRRDVRRDWSAAISKGLTKVIQRRRYHNACPWKKKIANKLSNMRKRRRRKSERSSVSR